MMLLFKKNLGVIVSLLFVLALLCLAPWIFRHYPQVGEISLWPPNIKLIPEKSVDKGSNEKVMHKPQTLLVGKDSVVIGNVSGSVGDRSVIIGATDNHGNTILNQPMAVGHNAHAGSGSIAIGANSGAGIQNTTK